MAYSQTLNIVVGDTLPVLTFTVRDSNTAASGQTLDPNEQTTWAPIDLTGAAVKLLVREVGNTDDAPVELAGTLTDADGGVVAVAFDADTFPAAGVYEGELQITFAGGGIQTVVDLIKFKVRAEF
jgi:hypothetical protein